jgi:toxin YhaV
MFFKFFTQHNDIYYAWINDEHTLRKEGAKTDCYYYFKIMLDNGAIPSTHQDLKSKSVESLN